MLDGFIASRIEASRLDELEQKLKSARVRGENKCVKCGFCCHKRTCIPTPDELKKIAEFLNLTPKELISKFFAIDCQSFSDDYYVKPVGINIKDLVGKFIPSDRTFNEGKCIFLGKDNNCKIYPVRPKSAKLQKCWEENKEKADVSDVLSFWKGNILKKEFGIEINENE